jgi:hypothetical protein
VTPIGLTVLYIWGIIGPLLGVALGMTAVLFAIWLMGQFSTGEEEGENGDENRTCKL